MNPIMLKFSYRQMPAFRDNFEAEWCPEEKVLCIREGVIIESSHPIPPTRWKAFWQRLDSMGAWDWPAEAKDRCNDMMEDGPSWNLEISDGNRHLNLSDATGLPQSQNGRKPFAGLIRAIKALYVPKR